MGVYQISCPITGYSEVSEVYSEEEAEEVFVEEVYNEFGIDLDKEKGEER